MPIPNRRYLHTQAIIWWVNVWSDSLLLWLWSHYLCDSYRQSLPSLSQLSVSPSNITFLNLVNQLLMLIPTYFFLLPGLGVKLAVANTTAGWSARCSLRPLVVRRKHSLCWYMCAGFKKHYRDLSIPTETWILIRFKPCHAQLTDTIN